MSKRNLKWVSGDLRKAEYVSIPDAEIQEAIWEALGKLHEQGINIGPKAEKILERRSDIKTRIPKTGV